MTHIGHLVVGGISTVIVACLMIKSLLDIRKQGNGSVFLLLVPVLLFLMNTI